MAPSVWPSRGKCYLSLHEQGKSANRGSCSQICRRSYEVKDKETGIELEIDNQYIMSPKDLKTIHFLNKMLDAGVRVLKIEGRARGPEYVDTVVRAYREAVDTYCAGNSPRTMSRSGTTTSAGLQPRLLGRLLSRPAPRRMDVELRLFGYEAEGLRR